jgi:glutaconate CoA-transferase subunit B
VQIHPGVTVEEVKENTSWDLKVADNLSVTAEPTQVELEKVRSLVASSRN